jgi:hypothetical protein
MAEQALRHRKSDRSWKDRGPLVTAIKGPINTTLSLVRVLASLVARRPQLLPLWRLKLLPGTAKIGRPLYRRSAFGSGKIANI